jgi:16S rRNA (adenine(1408)-N(1))-methyltransferase
METIRGKASRELDFNGLRERLSGYKHILLDLGTGDGRYVRTLAEHNPDWFAIGVDTCRENLQEHSRAKACNMLFIIAGAQNLPRELSGRVARLTINFPWGSLLDTLLSGDTALLDGIRRVSHAAASLEIRLNGGALAEMGTTLETGASQIGENLSRFGWQVGVPHGMSAVALREFPSTWARRLAVGRDPRAIAMEAWVSGMSCELTDIQCQTPDSGDRRVCRIAGDNAF